jgi:hypothetical protein
MIVQMLTMYLHKAVKKGTRGDLYTVEYKKAWKRYSSILKVIVTNDR